MFSKPLQRRRGFTLPEALLAIVVLGVGLAGLMLALSTTMRRSADPMLHLQMVAIAEGLMEEIQLKPYASTPNAEPSGCARDTFNDVIDYIGYATTGICTIDGVVIPALAGYGVSVMLEPGALYGVSDAIRIIITVTQGSESLRLVSWRTNYAGP